jgi:hypothetical protein
MQCNARHNTARVVKQIDAMQYTTHLGPRALGDPRAMKSPALFALSLQKNNKCCCLRGTLYMYFGMVRIHIGTLFWSTFGVH